MFLAHRDTGEIHVEESFLDFLIGGILTEHPHIHSRKISEETFGDLAEVTVVVAVHIGELVVLELDEGVDSLLSVDDIKLCTGFEHLLCVVHLQDTHATTESEID